MAVYACSDLHAQYNLWTQIKNFIKPEDTLYNLGDTIDRGPAALEILNESIEMPNVILLRGNHEDFINSIGSKIMHYDSDDSLYYLFSNVNLWYMNGGANTIKAFCELSKIKQKQLINKIQNLPTHIEYINTKGDIIYLCHAGRQPNTIEIFDMHEGDIPMNNYIWDRKHLMQLHWSGKNNEYCVHGHTPVGRIDWYIHPKFERPKEKDKIYKYCDGHKINIDLGSFKTHCACLLNLDTFEPIYFKDKTIINNERK